MKNRRVLFRESATAMFAMAVGIIGTALGFRKYEELKEKRIDELKEAYDFGFLDGMKNAATLRRSPGIGWKCSGQTLLPDGTWCEFMGHIRIINHDDKTVSIRISKIKLEKLENDKT
jgi:hypothetical protein